MKRDNEEVVCKPPRHKKQNVFFKGDVFNVKSTRYPFMYLKDLANNFFCRLWYDVDRIEELKTLIALSDSDQYVTFEDDSMYLNFRAPYYGWPFLTLQGNLVWWILDSSRIAKDEDPMKALRGLFPQEFKELKLRQST